MSDYVYELAKKHHSVRKFKDQPLSEDVVRKLVEAGQSASTSSYLQTYSIIGVEDPEIKAELKEVSGQHYVVDNGYLFVFVLDYYRHSLINEDVEQQMETSFESAEDENGSPKPRLPFGHVFHKNVYNSNKAQQKETLNAYDQMVSKYYQDRTNGVRNETWSQQVAGFLSGKARLDMLEQLNKSGLMKR